MGKTLSATMKIAILAALCAVASANQVHRFSVHSHSQKQLLDRFVDDHEGSEVWDSVPGSHMDVLVQDEHMVDADNLPLYRSTFIQDVNSLIELSETQQIGADASDFHTAYHSSKNIAGFLESLSKKHAHADLVQLGSTVMGQKMVGLRIGDKSKPEILLQGGQHAREWIAPAALAYAADKLLEKDSSGVLKDFSVMMIPAANPDGYDFSRKKSSQMWRKNMEDFSPKKFAMLMESELGEEDIEQSLQFSLWSSDLYHGVHFGCLLDTNAVLAVDPPLELAMAILELNANAIVQNAAGATSLNELSLRDVGKTPHARGVDLLATSNLVLGTTKGFKSMLAHVLTATDRAQNLTDVDTSDGTIGLTEGTTHTGLETIGTSTRKHLVDTNVESIFTRTLGHALVASNAARLKSLGRNLLELIGHEMGAEREIVD